MPFVLFYPSSAFRSGLPDEARAVADIGKKARLKLDEDTRPLKVHIADRDGTFDEIDKDQVLGSDLTVGKTVYPAGTPVHAAYDLINSDSGLKVTSLHFGGDGYEQGKVDGAIATEKLEPGKGYKFDINRTSFKQENAYKEYVACFTDHTAIATPGGARRIEDLRKGDGVWTLDRGVQPIRWIGRRRVRAEGPLAPVEFAPGVLGNDSPLRVSAQHRMYLAGGAIDLLFGVPEVFAHALHLVDDRRVCRVEGGEITYFHLLFDRHEIVCADGVLSESFLPGADSAGLAGTQPVFPTLAKGDCRFGLARPCLSGREARLARGLLPLTDLEPDRRAARSATL